MKVAKDNAAISNARRTSSLAPRRVIGWNTGTRTEKPKTGKGSYVRQKKDEFDKYIQREFGEYL